MSSARALEADAPIEIGARVAGKYRIDAVLGRGGMGIVCAATHEVTGKRVAIKMLHRSRGEEPGAAARIVREARAACAIEHPNVINVFDVGQDEGAAFIVMELLEGRTLGAVMAERSRLPAPDAIELMLPVLRGVAAAHAAGVLHRDLKPDNAFVCIDGAGRVANVKVLDFGVAKGARAIAESDVETTTGAIVGTASYMSPEQVRGDRTLDARADVYALGVLLYEALTGTRPFRGPSFTAIAIEIATAVPRPLRAHTPEIDVQLEAIVMRAFARDRDARFASVAELARALEPHGRGARFDDPASSRPWTLPAPDPGARGSEVGQEHSRAASETRPRDARTSSASAGEIPSGGAPALPTRPLWPWAVAIAVLALAIGGWLWARRAPSESSPPAAASPHVTPAQPASAPATPPVTGPAAQHAPIAASPAPPPTRSAPSAPSTAHASATSRSRPRSEPSIASEPPPSRVPGVRTTGLAPDEF